MEMNSSLYITIFTLLITQNTVMNIDSDDNEYKDNNSYGDADTDNMEASTVVKKMNMDAEEDEPTVLTTVSDYLSGITDYIPIFSGDDEYESSEDEGMTLSVDEGADTEGILEEDEPPKTVLTTVSSYLSGVKEYITNFGELEFANAFSIYDFAVTKIDGTKISMEEYKGSLLLIVNVASNDLLALSNYQELNELYDEYEEWGLKILAFPSDSFFLEPGTNEEIQAFVESIGVRFDMFEKVSVNGDNTDPLWNFLKVKEEGFITDSIKWNFTKFLVSKKGEVLFRIGPLTSVWSLKEHIEHYLDEPMD